MAKVEEKAAREDLKKNGPKALYFLYGEDQFKIQEFITQVCAAGAAETYFGDEIEPAEFLDNLSMRSLWSNGQKIIVVRGSDSISAKKWESLSLLWTSDASDAVVIFAGIKADARTKHVQAIAKQKNAALIKFEPPNEVEALHWATKFAKEHGKKLSEAARKQLVSWAGSSLFDLFHDIQKAALYAGEAEEISLGHVEHVGIQVREESIFPVMDAVMAGNQKEALSGVALLLAQRQEPLGLVGLLSKQYGSILRILALRGEGQGESEIAQALRLHPFVAKKLITVSRRLGPYQTMGALAVLADADFTLKSSREPVDLVMSRTVMRLMPQGK